uniref:Putative ATP dependent Clp protease n=1 Tax=Siphoviridae sp. ctFSL3 TaxID=2825404 RepID=A0A8S5PE37_9CAUD|nr:MAG TPA: putative ATP dependent Clp protease [Siphoviridae sp. ctFSL3]
MRKFWKWKNQLPTPDADESQTAERVLELYGTIAEESWFDDDITPRMFKDELLGGKGPITVWINSPGGDCVAASQIYAMLMDYPGEVTVKVDGLAASAASVIAMAGTKVLMAPTAMLMIHNPMTAAFGDSTEMQKAIEMLTEVKESIINAYEIKTGLSRSKLARLMDEETWMNAKRAIELGFCDGLLESNNAAEPVVAFAFSRRACDNALYNKLTNAMPNTEEEGRSVEELKRINKKLKEVI